MECNLHLTLPSGHGGRNGDIQNAIKEKPVKICVCGGEGDEGGGGRDGGRNNELKWNKFFAYHYLHNVHDCYA